MSRHRGDALALLLILAAAAGMRLARIDIVEYFHDDAMLASLALDMTRGGEFPLVGILSSTGIPNSPASVYMLALPFSLSSDPRFAIHFVMLLNVFGVGLLWLLSRIHVGRKIAFFAALLYAVNPWAVLFSRKLWAQELHTPLILLGMILLLHGCWKEASNRGLQRGHRLAQALSLPLLCFGMQMHFAAFSLLPAILFVIWHGRRRIAPAALATGLALSLLVTLPYFAGLAETLEADPARISDALDRSSARGISLNADALSQVWRLVTGTALESWMAPDQSFEMARSLPPGWRLCFLAVLALVASLAVRERRRFAICLTLWAFAPLLPLSFSFTPAYIHYFIPSLPALALSIGIGFVALLQRASRRWMRIALWTCFAVVVALQALQWSAALEYVSRRHIRYPGFTTPLADLLPLRDHLRQADDVLVVSHGMAWDLHHEVAVWETLLRQDVACVRTIAPDGYAVFPDHAFIALVAPDAPEGDLAELYATEAPISFPTRIGGKNYVAHQWDTAPEWQSSQITPIDAAQFANGVVLTGYALENDEALLEWRLPAAQPGEDFQYSAQLYDAAGERLAQWDARFWHGRHFCENDRLLTWGPLPFHDAATTLKVALYKLGKGAASGQFFNAAVLDERGNPKSHSLDITLPRR